MVFLSQKVDGNIIFTDYWNVVVLNFSVMGNTVFSWAKKFTEIWYLLITGKFLFWTFRWLEIRSFFGSRSWRKDDIYWLQRSFCFELFGDEKHGLFFTKKVDGNMIFTWSFLAFYDIPGPGKYVFTRSAIIWNPHYLAIGRKLLLWSYLSHNFHKHGVHMAKVYRALIDWLVETQDSSPLINLHRKKTLDGCFHKNLEIHVSSSLPNKEKHSAFMQTKIFLLWWRHHARGIIDGCFHKNLEIHVSSSLPNKQKHSAFTQTKIFLVWWRHHARGVNMIIGS